MTLNFGEDALGLSTANNRFVTLKKPMYALNHSLTNEYAHRCATEGFAPNFRALVQSLGAGPKPLQGRL